ncbi:hypothetical protein LKO27_01240 [Tessaracoccus sp. OS52]|uniref:hypothetical protein n=1 Tax=Tessaracoccus sp. OS52 TaxID=2886691 RepID=UPI001D11FD03|nr:hypothetical protein [Tessaracoccus sp. OS52]MCC2592055.1 hypothetical protein [Tessaracoccus sp. OS52]
MLAGIVISVLVIAGLAFGLPWLAAQRDAPDVLEGDPTERFSDSMRILRRDIADYLEDAGAAEVSTPLTRKAELTELRLLASSGATRRRRALLLLVVSLLAVGVTTILGYLPWWSVLVPVGGLLVFVGVARFEVAAMRRRFDARAQAVAEGWGDEEETTRIELEEPEDTSREFRVDLSAPQATGALWDPIPVTAPTYVSKPLVPRTVRTIDLSAPVVVKQPLVPTADRPDSDVEELELEDTQTFLHEFRPRAVGE